MKKLVLIGLFFIFAVGYFLRVMFLPQGALTFGYDQARDATIARQILAGDLKIQGPPASTPGLYHGVFYYYVLAPGYLFGNGSPVIAAYWIAFLAMLTVFIIYILVYKMTNQVVPALLSAFLYAISFESTQYATWLSNPTIAIWTVPLMYLGLWLWVSSGDKNLRRIGSVVAAAGLALSVQAEIFLLYHLVPLLLWLWIGRKKISKRQLFFSAFIFMLFVITMIANEVKFGFRSLSGFSQLAVGTDTNLAYAKSVGDYLILYLNQIGRIFAFNSYPGNIGYGGVFVITIALVGLWKSRTSKNKIDYRAFLASWLFSHITVVTVGGVSTPFLMVGIGPAVSMLLGITLYNWWKNNSKIIVIFVLIVLMFGNLTKILKENPHGSTLFSIQKDMLLSKQLDAINYTYQKAAGEKFSINTLTSPLWVNIVWDYLYKWEGQNKYGYLPQWHGRDQIGQLGGLNPTDSDTKHYFLILEPMGGIPVEYLGLTVGFEDVKSKVIEQQNWGEIIVQYREKLRNEN